MNSHITSFLSRNGIQIRALEIDKRRLVIVGLLFCIGFVFVFSDLSLRIAQTDTIRSSYYHLLIPASESNAGLCKTIFSAAALGYPTPRLLNWQRKFENDKLIFGGSHLAKIEGILGFLRQLGPQSDHDLVCVIDGYDVWFQLRPEVMISRYHEINERSNARIRSRLGPAEAQRQDARQTVVFSAQKKCWPASADDPACFAVPESELPEDVYGPNTDKPLDDEKNSFARMRQRYLNSGTLIGPVGDVRAIMERAAEKMAVSTNFGSDQGIFADIFGEQEYQREASRLRNMSLLQKVWRKISSRIFQGTDRNFVDSLSPTQQRMTKEEGPSKNYEFHLGLDYLGELSQPTVFSENDLAWIRHDDREEIEKQVNLANSESSNVFAKFDDIAASTPPFWALDIDSSDTLRSNMRWTEVPLYTNVWTGHTPAAIHHNAHHDGLKERIKTFWNETWYFPHLRDLIRARNAETRVPVAVLTRQNDDGWTQEQWWDPIDERGGVRIDIGALPGEWISWQDLCGVQAIADEVFRDGKGPWMDRVVYLSWKFDEAIAQLNKWKQESDVRDLAQHDSGSW